MSAEKGVINQVVTELDPFSEAFSMHTEGELAEAIFYMLVNISQEIGVLQAVCYAGLDEAAKTAVDREGES